MTTRGLHHPCGARARSGRAFFIGAPLLVLAVACGVIASRTDGVQDKAATTDGAASLQTLVFIHRGDLQIPSDEQP